MDLTRVLLTAFITASAVAGAVSCAKSEPYLRTEDETVVMQEQATAVSFSTYYPGMATKAVSYSGDDILGHWVDSISTYIPGTGIGLFAFYQKAKSNGYPTNFNKNTGEPTFMYNQLLERTTSDGVNYTFEYTPKKYWPNNNNDQISFFAYAPYDVTTAWEDLQMVSDLKGTKITRRYVVEKEVTDQTDFLWADPVLNMKKPTVGTTVDFNFRHLCARISVTSVANINPATPYMTVDSLAISGRFTTSGKIVYEVSSGTIKWEDIHREESEVTYIPFKEQYSYNTLLGRDTSNAIRITDVESLAHPKDGYIFVLPGVQDIRFSYVVSQRNPTTGDVFKYRGQQIFPSMQLTDGKAYNFKLCITLTEICIDQVAVINVSATEVPQNIP